MGSLRLAFMGTADFAVPTLCALHAAGHDIVAVYTQPPRPAGRGKAPRPTPVERCARAEGLAVRSPRGLKDPAEQAAFAALALDLAVVVAYGLILPAPILAAPRLGCVNLHASLLPRWRGAAPIERAIMAGDETTGVCVMQLDEGLDTGPILACSEPVPIGAATTAGELRETLADIGAALVAETVEKLARGGAGARAQPTEGVSYARKIDKAEGRIDWRRPAAELDRLIRALMPAPGAWFELDGQRIKVHSAAPVDGEGTPGRVLDDKLTIACGVGALRPLIVQRAGKAPLETAAFLRGTPIPAGTLLP